MAAADLQCPVPCDYCERSGIGAKWWCETCPMSLCNECRIQHLKKSIWKSHKTIPLPEKHLCLFSLYCKKCDECVCKFCIHKEHNTHLIYKSEEILPQKVAELENFKRKLEDKILLSIETAKEIVKIKWEEYFKGVDKLKEDINVHRKEVVNEIRKISEDQKENIDEMEKCQIKTLTVFRDEIQGHYGRLIRTESRIQRFENEKLRKLITFLRENTGILDSQTRAIPSIFPKELISGTILSQRIQRQIGALVFVEKLYQHPTLRPPNFLLLDDYSPMTVVYIGNRDHINIQTLQLEAQTLSRRSGIPTDFRVGGFAKVHRRCFLVSDRENHCVLRVQLEPWTKEKRITTGYKHPHGIAINIQSEIVVCSFGIVGEISIYSPSGAHRKQVISNDSHGMTMAYDPQQITQNHNGDYILIDKNINQYKVVAINSVGNTKKWTFPKDEADGKKDAEKKKDFRPEGLACDKYYNILVSDHAQNEVIILNQDGNYLHCLLTAEHGIFRPLGLAIDSEGWLWVGQKNGKEGTVSVFKYIL